MEINRYEVSVGTLIPITKDQWIDMVKANLNAFKNFKPDGVYAGLNLSCMISVPFAKLPIITQVLQLIVLHLFIKKCIICRML